MPAQYFMFATGIENSCPTIDNGRTRIDEMAKCGHYKYWQTDFELLRELDISYLRYGPPIHTTFLGPGRYDWEFADLTFGYLKDLDIVSPPMRVTSILSMNISVKYSLRGGNTGLSSVTVNQSLPS